MFMRMLKVALDEKMNENLMCEKKGACEKKNWKWFYLKINRIL